MGIRRLSCGTDDIAGADSVKRKAVKAAYANRTRVVRRSGDTVVHATPTSGVSIKTIECTHASKGFLCCTSVRIINGMLMKGCRLVERILCLLVSVTMILIIILICKYNVQKCEHFDLLLVVQTFSLAIA